MKFISLFAGIGGFDLGLERAGMECVAQVEIDPFCLNVLSKHWPNVPKFEDVRNVGRENLPAADLICGGFPCQPHSYAGKRKGTTDDRDLWPEYRRIIDECRPRWVIGENVPGIRTTILDQVLSDLEGMDYTVGTLVIPACAFDAPHRRDRVWIVAHNDKSGRTRTRSDINQQDAGTNWRNDSAGLRQAVPNAPQQHGTINGQETPFTGWAGQDVPNSKEQGLERAIATWTARSGRRPVQQTKRDWWAVEPSVGRVAHGIPNRVDRLRALGNAVVPQVVEFIGRAIMQVDAHK